MLVPRRLLSLTFCDSSPRAARDGWKAARATSVDRQPVVILFEESGFGPAWIARVFNDGSVIDDREGREPQRLEGMLGRDDALALARRVRNAIGRFEIRRELRASDRPFRSIGARVGAAWTKDREDGTLLRAFRA